MPLLFFFLVLESGLSTAGVRGGTHGQLLLILNQVAPVCHAKRANYSRYSITVRVIAYPLSILINIATSVGICAASRRILSRRLLRCISAALRLVDLYISNLLARNRPTAPHALPLSLLLCILRASLFVHSDAAGIQSEVIIADLALIIVYHLHISVLEASGAARINIHIEKILPPSIIYFYLKL